MEKRHLRKVECPAEESRGFFQPHNFTAKSTVLILINGQTTFFLMVLPGILCNDSIPYTFFG
jgi:hypothetical protein